MTITIEKSVPLPRPSTGPRALGPRALGPIYPFRAMAVGDSFTTKWADSKSPSLEHHRNSLLNCAKAAFGGSGKVAMRKLDDGSGFRIWRIA